jgi:regulator of protease activity HflC (stomatin/prohibitin superfamily)
MGLIDWIFGMKRFLVHENERVITLYKGKVTRILGPGEHLLANRRNRLSLTRYDIVRDPYFTSNLTKVIMSKIPDQAQDHLTTIQTSATEVALIERDGQLFSALGPDEKIYVWNDAGPWSVSKIDVSKDFAVSPDLLKRAGVSRIVNYFYVKEVLDGQVALVYIDGAYDRKLGPGLRGFWRIGKSVVFKIIDTRRQSLDVSGQEVLTKDRVTIRVNIAADYKVVDPLLATTKVKDFEDALYRSLQYAFRKTLGALSLDQILEKKVSIDADAAEKVKTEMAEIGIEVKEITLKDVILPGDMREILNKVVTAEKEAEANVIRRREETNATRSLLNTAKVMADNPVMLRLKELEALTEISAKVDKLTIHNGTSGLMNDLVRLGEEENKEEN